MHGAYLAAFFAQNFGGLGCALGGGGKNDLGNQFSIQEELAHGVRVALTALGKGPVLISEMGFFPTGFSVAQKE